MSRFHTTRWSLVMDARSASQDARRALDELCRIYRPPVLAYVRRRAPTDADDLTQAFFEQLLRLQTHAAADPQRGRFRVFLLVALKRFLSNQAVAAHAEKRGGGRPADSLDGAIERGQEPADPDTPEHVFERAWAEAVVRQALLRLESEAEASGKRELFVALRPFLLETPAPADYAGVAERLGLRRNTVAVAIHRLRQRLHEAVRDELAETVADPADIEAELSHLQVAIAPPTAPAV